MRRILLLLTDLEIGGTPTVVRELAVRLSAAGAQVEVAGLSRPGPLQEQLWARGVKCTALGARGTWDLARTAWRLWRLLRQERIDTVVSFLVHANLVAALARLLYPRARYIQSIQTTQPWPRWHWVVQRYASFAAEKLIVPSPSVAAAAGRWSGVRAEWIAVIPNAVDPGEFEAARESRPAGAGTGESPPQPFEIGFVGRLDPVKRVPDLLRAVALLPADFTLHVFGEGVERGRIEQQVRRLGLGGRVTLHGAVVRPQHALASVDVLVLPSQAEGFGLVLIEAMAAGVPVVATHAPGIRDVVAHERTGLLVPIGAPAALAAAIRRVREDAELRRRVAEAGRAEVRARFSWEAVLSQYATVLGLRLLWVGVAGLTPVLARSGL